MPTRARIVVLGRQGSGKGTQSVRLAAHLGVPHVSTGDVFRAAVRDGTPLGGEVAALLDVGDLVPDDLVLDVVRAHAAAHDLHRSGFVFDGFPRTVSQAEAFFGGEGSTPGVDLAVELAVPVEVVVQRISKRRVCPVDGWTTTLEGAAGPVACPDGHAAVQRPDDTAEAVRRRLELYDAETGPVVPWFAARGQLASVDGTGSPDDVFARILAAVAAVTGGSEVPVG